MKIGIIMNSAEYADNPYEMQPKRSYFASNASMNTEIEFAFPKNLTISEKKAPITTADLHQLGMEVVRKSVQLEKRGFDAAIIYNSYDPGLEAARSLVSIPVIGSGRTAFLTALMFAEKIGVVSPYDEFIPLSYRWLRTNGFEAFSNSPRALNIHPRDIRLNKARAKKRFASLATKLRSEGAQMIFPQGLNSLLAHISRRELEKAAGIPVIDVGAYAIRVAEAAVRLKLTQSPLCYPR